MEREYYKHTCVLNLVKQTLFLDACFECFHAVIYNYASLTGDSDGDHNFTEVPLPPPRRRRKSHDCRSSRESVFCLPDNGHNTSSSSSMLSWYDVNQTTTPAVTPTTGLWIDVEQPGNEVDWGDHRSAADRFPSQNPFYTTKNNQCHQNSFYLHTSVSERVQLSETFHPACNDSLSQFSHEDTINFPKPADDNNCEIDNEEKDDSDSNGGGDNDDDDDIFASWKKKYGHFHHRIANTNNQQHYQHGSSFHTTVSETVQLSDTSPPLHPTVSDAGNEPKSADENDEQHKVEKQLSSNDNVVDDDDDEDDDDDIFASWKKKNEDFYHHIANNGWPIGARNDWPGAGQRSSRICELDMSVNMTAEHDHDSPTASSISASGVDDERDTDNASTSNGNGKHNGMLQLHYSTAIY